MKLLLGKPVAQKILSRLKIDISKRTKKPGLAVILVGDDKASHLYVALKEKSAEEIGMNFFRHDLKSDVPQEEVLTLISELNADESVDGIIVQLPLPDGYDTQKIIESIDPKKDADGFHPANTEFFLKGGEGILPVFPRAIMHLIESSGEKLIDKKALVVANSDEFGKIMSAMLAGAGMLSSYVLSGEISSHLSEVAASDIVVSAVGSPGLLRG